MNNAGSDIPIHSAKLTPESIAPYVSQRADIYWAEATGSTNDDAKMLAQSGAAGPIVCGAESQNAGRGRMGRAWRSGACEAIEMSIMLRPRARAEAAGGLGLVVALAISTALERTTGVEVNVKWPNDILIGGRKVCGVLLESVIEQELMDYVIIGIGVNINQLSFAGDLKCTATSVAREVGRQIDRAPLVGAIIDDVLDYTDRFFERGLSSFMEEYRRRSVVIGRVIDVATKEGTVTGKCVGFGSSGEILVSVASETNSYSANDVSVREATDV